MPHRILNLLPHSCLDMIETILLGLIAGYELCRVAMLAITERDWTRLMGPQGFTVGLLLAVIVLWGNGVVAERNRQKRADRTEMKNDARHAENRADIKALTDSMTMLSAEAVKAQIKSAVAQIENTKTVGELSDEVHRLTNLLEVSPCLVAHQMRQKMITQQAEPETTTS